MRVEPAPDRMNAAGVGWPALAGALQSAAGEMDAGTAVRDNRERRLLAGPLYATRDDVAGVVVAARNGRPVYVEDVARIIDGPAEAQDAVFHVPGPARATAGEPAGREHPAVTIALAKRPGSNASELAKEVLAKVEALRPRLLPADVHLETTRNYGQTAEEKSNELVEHLLIATLSVAVLIALAMGWRAGSVVLIAVPVTLALTLFIYFVAGYTLNRVTLFALIFSIGILVDDAIVVVENIEYYFHPLGEVLRSPLPGNIQLKPRVFLTVTATGRAIPRTGKSSSLLELLQDQPPLTLAEIQKRLQLTKVPHAELKSLLAQGCLERVFLA